MNFKPIGSRLVVVPIEDEVQKQGHILVPTTVSSGYKKGKVVAANTGHYENGVLVPAEVKVDDIIMYSEYPNVSEITDNGVKYHVVLESNVIVVVS